MSSSVERVLLPALVGLASFLPFQRVSQIIVILSVTTFILSPSLRVFSVLAVAVVLGLTKLLKLWEQGQLEEPRKHNEN